MSLNPFKVKAAKKVFEDKGIKVGDYVKITWEYDKSHGTGSAYHEGVLTELDEWVRVSDSPRSPGHLYLPITAIITVDPERRTIEKVADPRKKFDGIEVGDTVVVEYSAGPETYILEGEVLELSNSITVRGDGKHTQLHASAIDVIRKVGEKKKPNPFVQKAKAKENPFVAKAKAKRRVPGQ